MTPQNRWTSQTGQDWLQHVYDLRHIAAITFQPALPYEGEDVTVQAKVKNIGTNQADTYSIEIYNDANFDSTADPGELIFTQQYINLSPEDSITATTLMSSLTAGDYQIIARVLFALDENPTNDKLIKSFTVFPVYNSGNYAFMFDDRGWIITHPKLWDIPGVDKNGNPVPAYTEHSSKEDVDAGK